jgi:pSer/pThr/pTyr-binding forkhead associated (FHA) protein
MVAGLVDREVSAVARIWVHGENEGPTSYPIGDGLIIGRGDHCDLVLDDETVSWDHAEIIRRGASFLVADLGSRNGTVLNGRVIDRATRLSARDVIQIGPFRLELDLPRVARTKAQEAVSVSLTEDERAVARALVEPYRRKGTFAARPATRREIAGQLHISESSVRRRVESLARKLGLENEPPGDRSRMVADRVIALGLDRE